MNLSKTKYCNGIQCNKMLWLLENKPEEQKKVDREAIMDNGNYVHEYARSLFGNYRLIEFNKDLSIMIENTKKAITNGNNVICEASFKYDNNFCSVDILRKVNDEFEIYEVKGSNKVKDIFINDISYQVYVLSKLGYKISKCSVVTLNSDYVRSGDIELNKLFNINDVTEEVFNIQDNVEENINKINNYMQKNKEGNEQIDNHCFNPYECPFFDYCTKDLPENNVFKIAGMYKKEKVKLYNSGIYSFEDLLKSDIKDIYKQQIEYELKDLGDYIDLTKIKEFLDTLNYPLYFLDFETFQSPIPPYDGISPYDQIPFQYSLHYIENDELLHKEFLAESGKDPRRELALSLVNDIPKDVCVLAYNMSFEKNVIKKLAMMYPDLHDHLMNIFDNIKDLMIPFKYRYYYNKAMKGSFSIKYVLPALYPNDENLDYHNLDLIHNGSEAMNSFANLDNYSKEEQEYIRERLLRYCELDTYAMVKVYEKLIEKANTKVKKKIST